MIGDLGIGSCLAETGKANTFVGSPFWMAPEVVMAMETGTYGYAADIWSFGITLIGTCRRSMPWQMSAEEHLPSEILTG